MFWLIWLDSRHLKKKKKKIVSGLWSQHQPTETKERREWILLRYFQPIGAEHVNTNMFQSLNRTQSTTVSKRTHKLNTHSRSKEKEDEDEGHGFSQRGSKDAESNLSFLHQSGLSLSLSPWFLKLFAQS